MRSFEPIAIVGRGCVLPGALSPAALWDIVRDGRVVLSSVPSDRWRLDKFRLLRQRPSAPGEEFIVSDRGGYVEGFETVFDPALFADRIVSPHTLDPLVHWLIHCGHSALREAGVYSPPEGSALIAGNLSYPTSLHARFVEEYWKDQQADKSPGKEAIDARNRFSSGLPVMLAAQALGLSGPSFALDAACSSSLYAIKLACDRLHDREADLMLAGGVNRADDLFIHLGFTALQALSPTGRSRPFHAGADGLVPAEGAAFVALRRLDDAVQQGSHIYGVIRGVGLSNDGREGGFLTPGWSGQVRAMKSAYEQSGLTPSDVVFVECHATGTAKGDTIEIESLAALWTDEKPVIGSLKANIGHSITASGAASLLKVLSALDAGMLPPAPSCEEPLAAIAAHGFRVPAKAQAWPDTRPRRAAISNFGFGGNNAHMIVEAWDGSAAAPGRQPRNRDCEVAITGMGVLAGETRGLAGFAAKLFAPAPKVVHGVDEIHLPAKRLGSPPADLRACLAQQTAILEVADQALAAAGPLDPERMGVYVGMGCDTVIARHGLRMRLAERLQAESWSAANADAAPALTAAHVVGAMPNIPANRLQNQRDWRGPGFTISSEELSGLDAMALAVRALQAHEIDSALVAACDFSCEEAHAVAARLLFPTDRQSPGDAAVALVLMRREDADALNRGTLATIDCQSGSGGGYGSDLYLMADKGQSAVTARFGHAHAASGLLHVAAGVVCTVTAARFDADGAWPSLSNTKANSSVIVQSFSRRVGAVGLRKGDGAFDGGYIPSTRLPGFRHFAAASDAELIECLKRDSQHADGPVRLGLVANDEAAVEMLRQKAVLALRAGEVPAGPGIYYGRGEIDGEIAHCFTGAAAAYPNAGRDVLLAFPEIGARLAERFEGAPALAARHFGAGGTLLSPERQLTGCALVCQTHAVLIQELLEIPAHAALGLSSGETNALLAFGVWRDLDAMLVEIDASSLYGHQLTGACEAAARYWGLAAGAPLNWRCWRIAAPVPAVEDALANEQRAYMTIIHHAEDCVIGGDAEACARVIDKIGRSRAIELGLDMVVHCAPFGPFAATWRRIHARVVHPVDHLRFYTNAGNCSYQPTTEAAADAITRQALEPVDFPQTVAQAYADGVRVFIEHGPRGILTSAISRVLGERRHLAVALDRREQDGLKVLAHGLTALWAAGVPTTLARFTDRLRAIVATQTAGFGDDEPILRLPAHPPAIRWPENADHVSPSIPAPAETDATIMAPPPAGGFSYDLSGVFWPAHQVASQPGFTQNGFHSDAHRPILQHISGLADHHRAYLHTQKDVHQRFLAMRRQASGVLASGMANVPAEVESRARSSGRDPIGSSRFSKPHVAHPASVTAQIRFTRAELEVHAAGRISDIFGPEFACQDGFRRQVRMPEPPLLLADRVMSLEGEAGSMGLGGIVTETDVADGAWYLHRGRMSPGLVIESGQADLMLISWLGADFLNRGERVYRLLGCELTFFGDLPTSGETLRYDIHVDGHAKTGDVRLFLFHYDCHVGDRLLLSVRNGQAGFFSDTELAESGGILWEAADEAPKPDARLDPPPRPTVKRRFSSADLEAFRNGDAYACFGEGFELAAAHQCTPNLPDGMLKLLDEINEFDPQGGPWGRGYLRARAQVPTDAWFYRGHFKNDPCMPGTLMADAATQALAFAMAAMGLTISRDGWRFAPVPEATAKFVCRGQVTPDAPHTLDYEIFIEEIIDGDIPQVFAALLCRCDGFKVFSCRRFGLRLVSDWPLTTRQSPINRTEPPRLLTADVRGDYNALLACAWGRPSDAFGRLYAPFDGVRKAPRLPGPPYHFMTRVLSVTAEPGVPHRSGSVISEYDIPSDAWYFGESGVMPFPVLLEALLQPCGWLASYMGFAASRDTDVAFRNLDGHDAVLHRPVMPETGVLKVQAVLDSFANAGGTIIVNFSVTAEAGGEAVMTLKTTFGFFSPSALKLQTGLPVTDAMRAALVEASPAFDADLCAHLHEDDTRLHMVDEITGFWPVGAGAGLGRIRGRQAVDPHAWYFKAHFFQDPVQPGSLGLHALTQLGECLLRLKGLAAPDARIEPIAPDRPISWRFRGQVVPTNREVITEVEVVSIMPTEFGILADLRGSLWADGLQIYEIPRFAMRVR